MIEIIVHWWSRPACICDQNYPSWWSRSNCIHDPVALMIIIYRHWWSRSVCFNDQHDCAPMIVLFRFISLYYYYSHSDYNCLWWRDLISNILSILRKPIVFFFFLLKKALKIAPWQSVVCLQRKGQNNDYLCHSWILLIFTKLYNLLHFGKQFYSHHYLEMVQRVLSPIM